MVTKKNKIHVDSFYQHKKIARETPEKDTTTAFIKIPVALGYQFLEDRVYIFG